MKGKTSKFLLSGDKIEIHLRQPGFTNKDCRPLTKNKERIEKFKETEDIYSIYLSE